MCICYKNNGLIEYFSNNERKTIEINYKNLNFYFYDYSSGNIIYFSEEMIIENDSEIQIFNLNNQTVSFERKTIFEYFFHKYQSTFTTYRLKENRIEFISYDLNESKQTLFESIKSIDINVEELHQ